MEQRLPVFGVCDSGLIYTPRRAAYAVIQRNTNFAAVRGPLAYFLPGGGCERGETFEQSITRELREEIGREITGTAYLGRAIQYFYAASDNLHYKMEAAFYTTNLSSRISGPSEHELEWLPIKDAKSLLFHASHAWAVHQASEGKVQVV